MRTAASRFRVVYWDSLEENDRPVAPGFAAGWLRYWLTAPDHRAEVIEAYSWMGSVSRPSRGWMDERDLNTFVRPVIERALLSGELVLVERTPISGWTPAIANMPREEATVGGAGGDGAREQVKSVKTWIEFQILDMEDQPLADLAYEAILADGTEKKGKTDSKGLVRLDDIEAGLVEFKLPEVDEDAWEGATGPSSLMGPEKTFVEIHLLDENEAPIEGQAYSLTLPDGSIKTGKTGPTGIVRYEEIDPGDCEFKLVAHEEAAGKDKAPPPVWPPPPEQSQVELELVDAAGQPVAGQAFEVTLPDGSTRTGKTDASGKGRVEKLPPGQVLVSFSRLDEDAWSALT